MLSNYLPPGPDEILDLNADEASFNLIGQLLDEYGDIVCLKSSKSDQPHILINHPDLIKQVFVTEHQNVRKGTGFDRIKILLGNGLIVSEGEFWKRQKRMVQPLFHKDIIKNVSEMMRSCNRSLLQKWQSAASENQPINITKDASYLALEIILRALFSEDYDDMSYKGVNPFFILAEHTTRDLDLVVKFQGLTKYVKECMHNRVKTNRYPHDYLSMLMQMEDRITHERMSEKEVIDEVMTLIVAAHETTLATINWVWYFISEDHEVLNNVHSEIEFLNGDPPTFEELQNLSFIRQIIDEVLRLYPPVWLLSREALGVIELGEYSLKSGTNIFLSPYYIHRHPRFWQHAEDFQPGRFSTVNSKNINRYTYFPFSMGQRRCPGEFFAIIEMQIHIAYICNHLKLKYIEDKPIKLEPLINLRTEQDIYMLATHRH